MLSYPQSSVRIRTVVPSLDSVALTTRRDLYALCAAFVHLELYRHGDPHSSLIPASQNRRRVIGRTNERPLRLRPSPHPRWRLVCERCSDAAHTRTTSRRGSAGRWRGGSGLGFELVPVV